jgi:hypothetical protein
VFGINITAGNNNIDTANAGVAGDSATIRIGGTHTKTFVAGVHGTTIGLVGALPVLVDP